MIIKNITPQTLMIYDNDKNIVVIEPEKGVPTPRVASKQITLANVQNIAINKFVIDTIDYLPPPEKGVLYIISRMTMEAMKSLDMDTTGYCVPGPAMRDATKKAIGCRGLSFN